MNRIYLANALVTDKQGRMLVVRKKNSIYFQMVGGKIDADEIPSETLKREFLEEINIDIDQHNWEYLGKHETVAANEANTIVCANVFHVQLINLNELKIASEIEEMAWVDKENYSLFTFAHLLEEFSLPIWLNM